MMINFNYDKKTNLNKGLTPGWLEVQKRFPNKQTLVLIMV